jgi:alpha-beta hydrolase superfamily lysophospholipase
VLDAIAERVGARVIEPVASDGVRVYGWHRPAKGDKCVVFCHGNAETIADRVPLHDFLVEHGFDVVLVAYRGYPGSDAVVPSEEGCRLDARAAWEYATETLNFPPSRVIVHGKSLGGGVAAMLCEDHDPAGLVMESTFLSIQAVADGRLGPLSGRLQARHPFDTRVRAPLIDVPVLVIHADQDQVIPVEHGRELARLFPAATYVEVASLGHGETLPLVDPEARRAYVRFLGIIPTAAH